ncbi:uncharacterized protein LOC130405524 isoform X1 [Gadus chalcogrammus]|uniref:uncharacterized protein LOC130405524 isoform X1 n=1 Tax=Gadus chalcogrammus TaxID=1042646 RepID=UPI0024C4C7B8|nr:uncharacterized protein LOC130405524 isoform X1 [Gadus chalcogrammus]
MFGATHALAIDGYSSKIVGYATMPVKNNLIIYGDVYRSAVLNYGLWDQVRVDHGREFYLTLFMQENLQAYRNNQDRRPYLQTKSTENHRIERIWVEVNNRVNYPLKAALVDLQDKELVNMEDNAVKFCTSKLLCQVSSIGIERVVGAWNAHAIPGRGVPNHLAENGCKVKLSEELLPSPPEAAAWYDRELNSSLARDSCFGQDPFTTHEAKMRAEAEFVAVFTNMAVMYEGAVHNHFKPFQDALLYLIDSARRHA